MKADRTVRGERKVARSALAGLLTVLLLVFGLLVASGPLHRSFHHQNAASGSFCAVCLLAQGQVELPDAAAILIACVFFLLCGLLADSAGVPWSIFSLLPPGRAPPRLPHIS